MARSTRKITASLAGAERLITAETVEMATPARLATSFIVATLRLFFPPVPTYKPNVSCLTRKKFCCKYETLRVVSTGTNTTRSAARTEGGIIVKAKFATLLLAAGMAAGSALLAGDASAGSDATATLRVLTMGGDAQAKSIGKAVARFNKD